MNPDPNRPVSSRPWLAPLAGAALFLLWGLALIAGEIPQGWFVPPWLMTLIGAVYIGILVVPPLAFCLGWVQGFPPWSYPYVAQVLVFSLYMTMVATPGFELFGYPIFGRELWGWRAWIPAGVATLIALGITRSFNPLRRLFTQAWRDWTLFTFGMCGFLPLLVAISFDEIDRLYSLYFMIVLAALMTGMALLYLCSRRQGWRIAALLMGIVPTVAVAVTAPAFYWQTHGWANLPMMVVQGIVVLLVFFAPAAIGVVERLRGSG